MSNHPESLPTGDALADVELLDSELEDSGYHKEGKIRSAVTRIAAALRSRQHVADGYAGATVWVGDRRCTQIVSETEIKYERDTGNAITNAAQHCLDVLATKDPHP